MRRITIFVSRGMLCIFCFGLLFVACQNEVVNPGSPIVSNEVITPLQKVAHRPISDFLSTQVFATFWTSPRSAFWYAVDFAGAVDRDFGLNLGTSFEGTVTERPLNDGTAEVIVDIRSHNVVTWMFNPNTNLRVFGMDPWSIRDNHATPTLGDVHFKWTLTIPAPGAPIPSVFDVPGTRIQIEASAFGPLTAEAGLGPDGTPGHGWVNQVGLLTKVHGHPAIDGFAAEVVGLQRVGN